MKITFNTPNLVKAGVAVAVIAISAVNFSKANNKSILAVSDAKADMICHSLQNSTCSGYTSDGVYHEVSNAEN